MDNYKSTFHQHNGVMSFLFYRYKVDRKNKNILTEDDVKVVCEKFIKEEGIKHNHHYDIFRTVQNNWGKFVKWCKQNLTAI